ncbi:hypothetical protein E3E12_02405 [Formicincola oecophyllae]|uniref:Uncharacterized protein n=1 Tax=Formicincola oecophyllae TaxID=2558361 RepID=A0A4Y6U7F6_9PROT|nr:hypothetical protein [Formicincola oecophyllae]QDH13242.1 hypothetical protein E3E12_02405 [Formicincola oecophyllae]
MAISHAIQQGRVVCVYGQDGRKTGEFFLGNHEQDGLMSFDEQAVSVRRGAFICTYNALGLPTGYQPA